MALRLMRRLLCVLPVFRVSALNALTERLGPLRPQHDNDKQGTHYRQQPHDHRLRKNLTVRVGRASCDADAYRDIDCHQDSQGYKRQDVM
jgi:hypothetical protein